MTFPCSRFSEHVHEADATDVFRWDGIGQDKVGILVVHLNCAILTRVGVLQGHVRRGDQSRKVLIFTEFAHCQREQLHDTVLVTQRPVESLDLRLVISKPFRRCQISRPGAEKELK